MKRSIPWRFTSSHICVAMLLSAMLLLSSTPAHSQSAAATGRLEGTISDPSGAAVPDAEVTVRNQGTGVSTVIHSSADGEFVVLYLDPGTYEVSIQKNGFGTLVLKDVAVSVGTRAILHPQLAVGRVGETVSVTAE